MSSVEECIEDGRCKATLFKQDACPYCTELKSKLDELGLQYEEQEVTQDMLDQFERETVPFLKIDNVLTGEEKIIENDSIESIKNKISANWDDDDF